MVSHKLFQFFLNLFFRFKKYEIEETIEYGENHVSLIEDTYAVFESKVGNEEVRLPWMSQGWMEPFKESVKKIPFS